MQNMGLFMDLVCLGDQKLKFSLGHGVYLSENGSISDVKYCSPQGRIARLLDQIELNASGGEEKKGKSIKQRSS